MAKAGAQYIDSGMTANTMVLAQQTGTLELPQHPVPLGSLLKVLASLRAPVGEIFKHKHQEKDGAFEINSSEPIAFATRISCVHGMVCSICSYHAETCFPVL